MSAPTYLEFRTLASSRGWTPKDIAPFVQSDDPEAATNRILYHLAGMGSQEQSPENLR
jgi:hypothetical protein